MLLGQLGCGRGSGCLLGPVNQQFDVEKTTICRAGNQRSSTYPLVNVSKNYGKIHHVINGKTHYFYGHFQ